MEYGEKFCLHPGYQVEYVCCEDKGVNWLRYNGTALFDIPIDLLILDV